MGILTGREDGLKFLINYDLAFIGPLTDYKKGLLRTRRSLGALARCLSQVRRRVPFRQPTTTRWNSKSTIKSAARPSTTKSRCFTTCKPAVAGK